MNIESIEKCHKSTCHCSLHYDHQARQIDTSSSGGVPRDVAYRIGSQERDICTDGVRINLVDRYPSIYIQSSHLTTHEISKLPWFWPWYDHNDIRPFHPNGFESIMDQIEDLDTTRFVIARRKRHRNRFSFELETTSV